jgi:hypothetical protein
MKTLDEPRFTLAGWLTQIHFFPKHLNIVCGNNLSPGLSMLMPLANTENCDALTPAVLSQVCPVEARSILFLDTAGIWVFIGGENRPYYNLNLLN